MKRSITKLAITALATGLIAAPVIAQEATAISTGRTDHQLIYEVIEEGLIALG